MLLALQSFLANLWSFAVDDVEHQFAQNLTAAIPGAKDSVERTSSQAGAGAAGIAVVSVGPGIDGRDQHKALTTGP